MPLLVIVGLLLLYAAVRVGWILFRALIGALCRQVGRDRLPSPLRPWVDRQAAYSLSAAWKALWGDEAPDGEGR